MSYVNKIVTLQDKIQRTAQNRAQLLSSPIMAKSTVIMPDGKIRIITVHQLATNYEFYVIYQTNGKTSKAPRKSWKQIQFFARNTHPAVRQYTDFKSFVEYYIRINRATLLSMPVHKTRRLAALYLQTAHESIQTDWTPIVNSTDPRGYRKLNTRLDKAISGRVLDEIWKGR